MVLLFLGTLKELKKPSPVDFLSVRPSYAGCVLGGQDLSQCLETPEIKDLAL